MFENILNQIAILIKASQADLKAELIKEIRTSEALIRSDIAYKRRTPERFHKRERKLAYQSCNNDKCSSLTVSQL